MEDVQLGGDKPLSSQVLARFGGPSFLRRAQKADAALETLLAQLRSHRDELLDMVRLRLGVLFARAASQLEVLVGPTNVAHLQAMHAECRPQLRMPLEPTTSSRVLREAVADLNDSIERFNRRWREHVESCDLTSVNRLRDEHNRFYLLEKECALRSPVLARKNYEPLPPLTPSDLLAEFPMLPTISWR